MNPEKAYNMMLGLILGHNLKGMYMNKVYEYHLKNFVMQQVVKEHLPEVFNHLTRKLQINIEMITTQWLMTMYVGFIDDPKYLLPFFDLLILQNGYQNQDQ